MNDFKLIEDKTKEELKIRTQRLALIEKLRSMGFTEKEIEYNFSKSEKEINTSFSGSDK